MNKNEAPVRQILRAADRAPEPEVAAAETDDE
jgi:hypothetical protein